MEIGRVLFMILQNIRRAVMKELPDEITFLEFKCLKIACETPVTQKEIIERTGMTKGTVSKAVRSLESKGLVVRKRSGKNYVVELTTDGNAMMKKLERISSRVNEILLRDFEEKDRQILEHLLRKMLSNLEDEI